MGESTGRTGRMRFTPGKSEAVLTGAQERVSPGEFKAREAGVDVGLQGPV